MSDEMKHDIETMKRDIGTLKADVSALRASTTKIAVEASRIGVQINDLATHAEVSKGFGDVMRSLDAFAGEAKASRDQRTLQDRSFNLLNEKLTDHELRLTRLEPRERKS
jgi:hypothetical protein